MSNYPRPHLISEIHELLTFVPDHNLERVQEAVLLLSDLLPPWYNKCSVSKPLKEALDLSISIERWVESDFHPASEFEKE